MIALLVLLTYFDIPWMDGYISGDSNPKFHKGDSLIQHQEKRKKCSKKG
jgi:hypothetical protein